MCEHLLQIVVKDVPPVLQFCTEFYGSVVYCNVVYRALNTIRIYAVINYLFQIPGNVSQTVTYFDKLYWNVFYVVCLIYIFVGGRGGGNLDFSGCRVDFWRQTKEKIKQFDLPKWLSGWVPNLWLVEFIA